MNSQKRLSNNLTSKLMTMSQ